MPVIFSLGDGAVTIDLGNQLSEALNGKVLAMNQWLRQHPFTGQKDIITAYSSLTLVFDPTLIKAHYRPAHTIFEWVRDQLLDAYHQSGATVSQAPVRHQIPVFYGGNDGPDLAALAAAKGMRAEELIHIHTATVYRVYMIGFLPGFAYLGEVDPLIAQPRKEKPVPVAAGSIGIAGSQTGIYPLPSPGGWNIIGRTPLQMFNPQSQFPVLLKAGDEVVFYPTQGL
ncbi:5-oxoprolinase subunit PxpB [Paraflavitalea pollutisoli]|uniref:5-oxoprolinase subunit PxpB n=1 Tax=Paraflavitalea pollutisoli TaxID=3034143 RepID=UPI0023ECDD0A|nr:5-oxoprolinase subunit PxpB [Paraflavitalea sp. H1-2-19X]